MKSSEEIADGKNSKVQQKKQQPHFQLGDCVIFV